MIIKVSRRAQRVLRNFSLHVEDGKFVAVNRHHSFGEATVLRHEDYTVLRAEAHHRWKGFLTFGDEIEAFESVFPVQVEEVFS